MAEGIVFDLAAKALEGLGKAAFNKAVSLWGARDELGKLENTMRFIQAQVREAERRQEDDSRDDIKEWLRRLKLVLYRADDLSDMVLTHDRQKRQRESSTMAKVGILFSKSSPLYYNMKLANEIKCIRKALDAIKSDMAGLNLTVVPADQLPLRIDRLIINRETASVVNTEDVVGRVDDKKRIVEMLFDPKYDDQRVTVIPIVGFGGLGKTTLAQLVYHDERVKKHFELIKWAYVPEKDNLKVIMGKIYKSLTGHNYVDRSPDDIKLGIIESIETKKYLLVLDDLWDEGGDRWFDLVSLLKRGKQGSKVLVTTRSDVVASNVGTIDDPYRLGTLTDDQSWDLFEKVAFKQSKLNNNPSFHVIGKEIVKMCKNVPLAIKVVGGFLRSKDTEEQWEQALKDQRSKAQLTKADDIMKMLKLSYDYLPPVLKQCFSYCSLLKKGALFSKDELVFKWTALGYLESAGEYTGDQLFSELLARSFFQDPEFSKEGVVKYCRMHDLLHDLAELVAGEEILGETSSSKITDGLVHANLLRSQAPSSLFDAMRMRSLLLNQQYGNSLEGLIEGFKYLRVLSIEEIKIEEIELLNSIEKLIHLRYLNIESRDIEHLPGSITRLPNLQTLVVDRCRNLKELPSDFVKLASLRHLVLPENTDLPSEFGKLTSLQRLNVFHVGKSNGIDVLASLNLRGKLHIKFHGGRRNSTSEAQRANLKNNNQLTALYLTYITAEVIPPFDEMNEMLMHLELPPNLKKLKVWNYKGYRMRSKLVDGLSKLVSITIFECNCKVLPDLSRVPHLKYVKLKKLDELEYVEAEDNVGIGCENLSSATHNNYYPSLEELELDNLPQLKGWTRASQDDREGRQLLFPNLRELIVGKCPELMSMPMVGPKLESLYFTNFKWTALLPDLSQLPHLKRVYLGDLEELEYVEDEDNVGIGCGNLSSATPNNYFPSLEELELDNLPRLKGWTRASQDDREGRQLLFPNLKQLKVDECPEFMSMPMAAPKLESLEVTDGVKWTALLSGLIHLPHLKYVRLVRLDELEYVDEDEDNVGIGCGNLSSATRNNYFPSLEELELRYLPRLKGWTRASPDDREGRHLLFPNLLQLEVVDCPELMSMPMAAPKLESLVVEDVKWTVFGSNVAWSHEDGKTPASGSLSPFLSSVSKSLQKLKLYSVDLVSLSIGCSLCKLNKLVLSRCGELESLRFESPNSIRELCIEECRRLRNIEGFQHLSALEELVISKLELEGEEEVEEEDEEEEENTTTNRIRGWQWQALSSLRSLELSEFSKWKKLPSGIACLTSLRDLSIESLDNLTELPQDIGNLSSLRCLRIDDCLELKSLPTSLMGLPSLQTLGIRDCPNLKERCKQPNGEDWHLIQHIPDLDLFEF